MELRGVTKSFGAQHVLRGIDVAFERGSTTVIIGPSGSGKSVLLKHIVGLLRPDAGEVWFEGQRIDQLSERALTPIRRQISFVFQLNALFDSMTVGENVAFPMAELSGAKVDRKKVDELVEKALATVGLAGAGPKMPADLSGGEKKRAAIARAIAIEPPPEVILYDEPTAGLDPQRSDVISQLIRRLQREVHVTGIVVTHDMKLMAEVADRVLLLLDGRFAFDGTPEELQKATDARVRRFVDGVAEPEDLDPGAARAASA